MDSAYGGAKPKVKTPGKITNTALKKDEIETKNIGKTKIQCESVGHTGSSRSTCEDFVSSDTTFLNFKEDHFDEKPTPKRPTTITSREIKTKAVGNRDKRFVKEFLPLTDELIKNAIKCSVSRDEDRTQIAQSSGSSTDLEGLESRDLPDIIECKKRKKELTPRDKWKRSGYALRKYLANKFGFGSVSKQNQENLDSCVKCLSTDGFRSHRNRQVEVNPNIFPESNIRSNSSINHSHDQEKTEKQNSHPFLNKVMKKGKDKNIKHSTNCNSESSTTPDESTNVSPDHSDWSRQLNSNPTNQNVRYFNLANQETKACFQDLSNKENRKKVTRCAAKKKSCDHTDTKLFGRIPLKPCSSSSQRSGKIRPSDLSKPLKTRKKLLVGVFDAQMGTSSDSENDDTKPRDNLKRRKRRSSFKDTSDTGFKLSNTDHSDSLRGRMVAGTPNMKGKNSEHSTTNQNVTSEKVDQPRDVLHGLKYALPYLPERLRNRLHSDRSDDDSTITRSRQKNMKSATSVQNSRNQDKHNIDEKINLELNSIQSGLRRKEADISDDAKRTSQPIVNSYGDYIKSSQSNQCSGNDKSGTVCKQSFKNVDELNKSDCGRVLCDVANESKGEKQLLNEHEEMPDIQNSNKSDIKFHLNESGTWTVTGLDKNNDKQLKGSNNNLWLPFSRKIGPIRRDSYTDWVEQDLMQLEASLEDPFNLRGDNLILNDSSSKGDNSYTGHDSDEDSFEFGIGNGLNRSKSESEFGMCEGLLDLVNGIDKPFIDQKSEENGNQVNIADLSSYKSSFWDTWRRHRDFLEAYDSDSQNSNQEDKSAFSLQPSKSSEHKEDNQLFLSTIRPEVNSVCNSPSKGNNPRDTFQSAMLGLSVLDEDAMSQSSSQDLLHSKANSSLDLDSSKSCLNYDSTGAIYDFDSSGSFHLLKHESSLDADNDSDSPESLCLLKPDCSLDADDEFECDCEHCISLRQHHMDFGSERNVQFSAPSRYPPLLEDLLEQDDYLQTDLVRMNEGDLDFGLQVLATNESSISLGLGVMLENVILQLLTDNVIMQMINVQPDLLSDQAPPPAAQSIIDAIPTINLSQQDIDQNPVCPVCLCPCNLEETMSQLPCQHIFHPICVQAWLVKSGTCPVCRYRMAS